MSKNIDSLWSSTILDHELAQLPIGLIVAWLTLDNLTVFVDLRLIRGSAELERVEMKRGSYFSKC